MIIKGGSRAGPRQLARHLQRADTNERVQVVQLDSPTENLLEAFRDWQLLSSGTRGDKGLYHANIDPDARYPMTAEQWKRAVDVLERELGLEGQPRAVVMHEKHGRQHVHVVWQRTDIDTMKLIHDSFNYKAHERASLALEKEFGHEIVPGKHAKRDREKQPDIPKAAISHAEWQQGERAGIDPRAFKDAITELRKRSDTGRAFQLALEERGLLLAKGDRRDYVIVDANGQVYSLARQIKGVTAKDLREFMSDIDRDAIPGVEQVKARLQEREHQPQLDPKEAAVQTARDDERINLEAALKARHEQEARELKAKQATEHARTMRILDAEIAEKLKNFDAVQQAAREQYDREHTPKRDGLDGFVFALRSLVMPAQVAEEERERHEARATFVDQQEAKREAYTNTLDEDRRATLADLSDRHAEQRRQHAVRLDEERARRLQDLEEAAKQRAEFEQRRRQEQLQAEQERSRDGPPLGRTR
ncbi:MAG: relaxase/mobilization nuclease domain-containing protein [Planctomycetota bacterium]